MSDNSSDQKPFGLCAFQFPVLYLVGENQMPPALLENGNTPEGARVFTTIEMEEQARRALAEKKGNAAITAVALSPVQMVSPSGEFLK